ncbi:peroxiredoxin [Novosphingobium sp. 9U]|uniref:peroxiredoxin n=1 Tax=Novosphingobium sp. 9U TaxID=2653158 RepID=UPI00135C78D6|nr:peroxiredoxin [Novosphingobium sp. 9U]
MIKRLTALASLAALALPGAAMATLPVGTAAPAFSTQGALGGKDVPLDLRKALRKGPVVLYFYPKAFTQGCTLEAHAFAEATPEFAKYGATVIGLSADDLPTLRKFSTEECRDKFTVGVASPAIIKSYDVALKRAGAPAGMTDRTSYVIAPNGKIVFVHSDLDFRDHVAQTLAAVKALKKR